MANRQQQHKLLVRFSTTCMIVVMLARLDSGGAGAFSISLNGNGNMLQQQHQQDIGAQHQLPHVLDNGEEHNFITQKSTTELVPNSAEILGDDDDIGLKGNGIDAALPRNQLSVGHPFRTLTIIKRAPGGFVGMRGKKNAYDDDLEVENTNENNNNNDDDMDDDCYDGLALPWRQLSKNNLDLINWDDFAKPNVRRYKKAPTAFYGVRGKKFTLGNGVNPSGDAYRWQQFLQKLDEDRVRDMIMDDFLDGLLNGNEDVQSEMSKRAPTGFTGVRGKRPTLSVDAGADSSLESVGKRGVGNAFVGVRGKKDVSHQAFKRSPLGGSESSAGGAGSKRQRFHDFGNKFVAVRGKKSLHDMPNDVPMASTDWTNFSNNNFRWSPSSTTFVPAREGEGGDGASMRLLYANSGKRAPTGFMGMRGKRPLTSGDVLTN